MSPHKPWAKMIFSIQWDAVAHHYIIQQNVKKRRYLYFSHVAALHFYSCKALFFGNFSS